MRAMVLVSLLIVGGLFLLATELEPSAGSNVDSIAEEVTLPPSDTPAPSPEADGTAGQTTTSPEPGLIPHMPAVQEQFLCTNCHSLNGGWLLSDSHRDTATQACEDCHAPAPNPASVVIHYTPGDTATQELCTLCHGGDGGWRGPPPLAPVVSEAQACASCHTGNQQDKTPEDHEGRSVATCALCHETQPLTAEPVPHKVEGWEDCSFCHGRGRLTDLSAAHNDIPEAECLRCHEAVETPPRMSLTMGHFGRKGRLRFLPQRRPARAAAGIPRRACRIAVHGLPPCHDHSTGTTSLTLQSGSRLLWNRHTASRGAMSHGDCPKT